MPILCRAVHRQTPEPTINLACFFQHPYVDSSKIRAISLASKTEFVLALGRYQDSGDIKIARSSTFTGDQDSNHRCLLEDHRTGNLDPLVRTQTTNPHRWD